jgi:hypothetical protein
MVGWGGRVRNSRGESGGCRVREQKWFAGRNLDPNPIWELAGPEVDLPAGRLREAGQNLAGEKILGGGEEPGRVENCGEKTSRGRNVLLKSERRWGASPAGRHREIHRGEVGADAV